MRCDRVKEDGVDDWDDNDDQGHHPTQPAGLNGREYLRVAQTGNIPTSTFSTTLAEHNKASWSRYA